MRHCAGQAVVQFAKGYHDKIEYAIKFFLDREAFQAEAALYAACAPAPKQAAPSPVSGTAERAGHGDANPDTDRSHESRTRQMSAGAARFLPKVERVCDGASGELVDPRGRPLPPCIVMEKGESLQDWSERAEPDLFTSLAVRSLS